MRYFISCFSISLMMSLSILADPQSVQDRGLPGAVAFEAVFPHVVSGALGEVQYQSDVIIVNSENTKALVELDFYFNSGESANDLLAGSSHEVVVPSWARFENLKRSPDNGRFYVEVPAHSARRLAFPGRESSLVGQEFSAWARLRSNVAICAYQQIRVVDQRGKSYQTELTSSTIAARSADLRIFVAPKGTSFAISLVNPRSVPAELELQLAGTKKTLTLAPLQKRALMLEELFGLKASGDTLTVTSTNGVSFAVLGLIVHLSLNPDSTPRLPEDEPWLTFRSPAPEWNADWLRLAGTERFNWPEEIVAEAHLGESDVILTRFGFIRKNTQGKTDVHPLNVGASPLQYVGITVEQQRGLGIIWYSQSNVPLPIFFKSGRALYVETISGPSSIAAVPDEPDRVEIRTGHQCFRTIIIVDTVKEAIVSVERGLRDPGAFCF